MEKGGADILLLSGHQLQRNVTCAPHELVEMG